MTDNIQAVESEMGVKADAHVSLLGEARDDQSHYSRHVAIEWEGGVLWLNLFDFVKGYEAFSPHYCIDIRQFNSAVKIKGQGVFTMARQIGRGSIGYEGEAEHLRDVMARALERCQVADDKTGAADEAAAILAAEVNLDGTSASNDTRQAMPQGHGWNGGYLVSILTDPDGQETHTDDEKEK